MRARARVGWARVRQASHGERGPFCHDNVAASAAAAAARAPFLWLDRVPHRVYRCVSRARDAREAASRKQQQQQQQQQDVRQRNRIINRDVFLCTRMLTRDD